jgi:hypothetical protein
MTNSIETISLIETTRNLIGRMSWTGRTPRIATTMMTNLNAKTTSSTGTTSLIAKTMKNWSVKSWIRKNQMMTNGTNLKMTS